MGNTILELNTFKDLMEALNSAASSWKHANTLITLGPNVWQMILAYRLKKKWNGFKLQQEKCKHWLKVWNTWIHRCTINQNLPIKQICKRHYKQWKFQRNFGQVTVRSSYISKFRRQHFVKISGSMYGFTTNLDNSRGEVVNFNSTNIIT